MAQNVDYAEQRAIIAVQPSRVATVVGTGAFGSWAALFAALAGVERLVLINPGSADPSDKDNVQGREIACGPFLDSDFGRPKVEALGDIILMHRPDIDISKHIIVWDESHADLLEGVVFAGISSDGYQDQIWTAAAHKGLRCVGGSYNATLAGVATTRTEMPTVDANLPAWVGSAALSGLMAVQAAFVRPFDFFGDVAGVLRAAPTMAHDKSAGAGSI